MLIMGVLRNITAVWRYIILVFWDAYYGRVAEYHASVLGMLP